jgi:catechol 2,3-dioxygenase-like lactoylglutathione lyase family enzyme
MLTLHALTGGLVAALFLAGLVSEEVMADETPRIKRISLMTPDIDRSIQFFTEVIGFSLDFEGTLPPNGEPFLGAVFNIDASLPLRRALLSTSQEPRGLFLIEHPTAPLADAALPTAVVTVIQVDDLSELMARAERFGVSTTETVTDVTPEGATFAEAMVTSPGGHVLLLYQIGTTTN